MTLDELMDKLRMLKAENDMSGELPVYQEGDMKYVTSDVVIRQDHKGNRYISLE